MGLTVKIHTRNELIYGEEERNKLFGMLTERVDPTTMQHSFDRNMVDGTLKPDNRFSGIRSKSEFTSSIEEIMAELPKSCCKFLNPFEGIQFPKKKTINHYKIERNVSEFVNESREKTEKYFERIYNSQGKGFIITGKVGSGKSVFMKYLYNKTIDAVSEINEDKVIYTIIEYNKERLDEEYSKLTDKKAIREYFERTIVEELLIAAKDLVNFDDPNIEYYFDSFIAKYFPSVTNIEAEIYEGQFINYFFANSKQADFATRSINKDVQNVLLFILKKLGYRFIVYMDGFDIFSLDEMIEKNQEDLFIVLTEHLRGRSLFFDQFRNEEELQISLVATLRDCTYIHLPEQRPCDVRPQQPSHVYLCPIGVKPIIQRTAYCYINSYNKKNHNINTDDIEKFFEHILNYTIMSLWNIEEIDDYIGIDKKANYFAVLFNHNYRRLIRYISLVLTLLFEKVYRIKKEDAELTSIINKYFDYKFLVEYITPHDISELFILGDSLVYNNYYWITETNKKNDLLTRGLLDNILDYFNLNEAPNDNNNCNTFIKIKICQILKLNTHISKNQILEKLKELGYTGVDDPYINETLKYMRNSGFIISTLVSDYGVVYKLSDLGGFVYSYYNSFNVRYIENIIQRSKLPSCLTRHMYPARKYDPIYFNRAVSNNLLTRDIDNNGIYWVFSCISNAIMFFHYARQVEANELYFLKKNHPNSDINEFPMTKLYKDVVNNKENSHLMRQYEPIIKSEVAGSYVSVQSIYDVFTTYIHTHQSDIL